jgi:hypothetical protein
MILEKGNKSIFNNRGALIDKGAIYVVVILTLLIFGGYILVGGTLPTKLPAPNTNLVNVIESPPEPTKSGLQLNTFTGVTYTPAPTKVPEDIPIDTIYHPQLIDCNNDTTLNQDPSMIWAFTSGKSEASGGVEGLRAFYTNLNALVLGAGNISRMTNSPADSVVSPLVGDQAANDQNGLPFFPSLFITDITDIPSATIGDAQYNGRPNRPDFIYGAWKASGEQDPIENGDQRGANADPWPPANGPGGSHDQNFTAEVVWKMEDLSAYDPESNSQVFLNPGNRYRVQVILHDGSDPSDAGVACYNLIAPTFTTRPEPDPPPDPPDEPPDLQ